MRAIGSLDNNLLCSINEYGLGKFTLDAINAIWDTLTKSNVQSIRCSLLSNMSNMDTAEIMHPFLESLSQASESQLALRLFATVWRTTILGGPLTPRLAM